MKYSLLYIDSGGSTKTAAVDDFGLSSALKDAVGDITIASDAAEIIANVPAEQEDTAFRQEICAELLAARGLLASLSNAAKNYDALKPDYEKTRRQQKSVGLVSASPESLINSVHVTATSMRKLYAGLKQLWLALSRQYIGSRGLTRLESELKRVLNADGASDLAALLPTLETLSIRDFEAVPSARLAQNLFYTDVELMLQPNPDAGTSVFGRLPARKGKNAVKGVSLDKMKSREYDELLSTAIRRFETQFGSFYRSLYAMFEGYSKELELYLAAARIADYAEGRGMKTVFPKLCARSARKLELDGLYDLRLLTQLQNADSIVPQTLHLSGRAGVVICGENGCGKTVLLRSLVTALLFAAAGLPVCARSAEISTPSQLCSLMAGEEERMTENAVGRFEAEAKRMAAIIEQCEARQGSMVALNEAFQTTDYDDASNGLGAILDYFAENGVFFAAVTHLDKLRRELETRKDGAIALLTAERGFTIRTVR